MAVESLTDFSSPLSKNKEKLLNIGAEDMKLVLKHYNLTEHDVYEMVSSIRDWLKKQPHLPGDKIKDQQIIGLLMFRGFSVEKFKSNLDSYCRAVHKMPDLWRNRNPMDPTLSEIMKLGYWTSTPKKTPENYRVTVFRMLPNNKHRIIDITKVALINWEYRIWNDAVLGECWIFDAEHTSLHDTLQMTPVFISNIIFIVLACFGARFKSVHVINLPSFAAPIINIFKSVTRSKLGERIVVSTKEDILKRFPKESLPNELGGEGGTFHDLADEWRNTLQADAWRPYFLALEDICTDESKRLTPLPDNEIFGVNGSFRNMSID